MSHDVETIAWAGEVPWHGLGTEVDGDITPAEMLRAASIDWSVSKRAMHFDPAHEDDEDNPHTADTLVPARQALVRDSDGAFLDIVGIDWEPLQNEDAFGVFKRFCEACQMTMEVAGALRTSSTRGVTVWGLAKIGDAFDLGKGDETQTYMLLSNPHRYGKSITAHLTPIRVVCQNTMTMALGNRATAEIARFAHNSSFSVDRFEGALADVAETSKRYREAAERLVATRWTEAKTTMFLNRIFAQGAAAKAKVADLRKPLSPSVAKALAAVETQPGADLHPGTAWNALNAVTFMTNHVTGRSQEGRLASTWYGKGGRTNSAALDLATEMSK